ALAILSADWLTGVLSARWWWRELVRGYPSELAAIRMAWLDAPRFAPAALAQLSIRGRVIQFARALPAPIAFEVTAAVARAFGASGLTPPVAAPATEAQRTAGGAPWAGVVPEATAPGLEPRQRLLLGVGLGMRRAPALARRPQFWQAAHIWLSETA